MTTTADLTFGEKAEARYALARRIDHLRETVRTRTGYTVRAVPDLDPDTNLQALHRAALWLAQAEHAYRKLGGIDDAHLPACYRTPPMPKKTAA